MAMTVSGSGLWSILTAWSRRCQRTQSSILLSCSSASRNVLTASLAGVVLGLLPLLFNTSVAASLISSTSPLSDLNFLVTLSPRIFNAFCFACESAESAPFVACHPTPLIGLCVISQRGQIPKLGMERDTDGLL